MSNNKMIGIRGERAAEKYLRSNGYSIINRNVFTPFGEIDLVVIDGNFLVFVEVKTRTSTKYGCPLSAIDALKKKHITKNCRFYLTKYKLWEHPARIDAIGIELDDRLKLKKLEHIKNAIELENDYS